MKYLVIFFFIVSAISGFAQSSQKNWEKAVAAVKIDNQQLVKTEIEFINVALTKMEATEIINLLATKEEIIDYVFVEGKTLIVYHYKSLDDSGLKSLIAPIRATFNVINMSILSVEELEEIYKKFG